MAQRLAAELLAFLGLEVDHDAVAAALDHRVERLRAHTLDPHHLGAHVGEQHRDMRARANSGEFDDLETR